jgi:hypothetical protein
VLAHALACATPPHEGGALPVAEPPAPPCDLAAAVPRAVRATSTALVGEVRAGDATDEVIVSLVSRMSVSNEPIALVRVRRHEACAPHAPRTTLDGFGPAGSAYTTEACVEGRAYEIEIVERSRREFEGDPPQLDALLAALADAC